MIMRKSPLTPALSREGRGDAVQRLSSERAQQVPLPSRERDGMRGLSADAGLLSPQDVYRNLMEARAPGCDEFDAHVVGLDPCDLLRRSARQAQPQTSAAGLSAEQFGELIAQFFPKAAAWRLFGRSESVERAPTKPAFSISSNAAPPRATAVRGAARRR